MHHFFSLRRANPHMCQVVTDHAMPSKTVVRCPALSRVRELSGSMRGYGRPCETGAVAKNRSTQGRLQNYGMKFYNGRGQAPKLHGRG